MTPSDIETIELLPTSPEPRQLFVLLHDAGGSAADMLALGQLLGSAFAAAVVVLSALALILFGGLALLERRIAWWRPDDRIAV